jgi:hypothetical protein
MDKVIWAILAVAVVLHLAGALETGVGGKADDDTPYMADSSVSSDSAPEEEQGEGADASSKPRVVVYGREASQPTQRMRQQLKAAEIDHTYKSIEDQNAMIEVGMRLKQKGHDKDSYDLPVVGIDDRTLIQPKPSLVVTVADPEAE